MVIVGTETLLVQFHEVYLYHSVRYCSNRTGLTRVEPLLVELCTVCQKHSIAILLKLVVMARIDIHNAGISSHIIPCMVVEFLVMCSLAAV